MLRDEVVVEALMKALELVEDGFVIWIQTGKFLVVGKNFGYCHK